MLCIYQKTGRISNAYYWLSIRRINPMAKKETCPHCGASLMKHKQSFTKALGGILLTLAYKFPEGQPFHPQRDITLTKNQYNNLQKLRYFGLIKKVYTDGTRDGGFWELTGLTRFVINGKRLPKYKWTFRNEVIESSEELISLQDAAGLYETPAEWAFKAESVSSLVEPDLFSLTKTK